MLFPNYKSARVIFAVAIIAGASDTRAATCEPPESCNGILYNWTNPPDYHRYGPIHCRRLLVNGIWIYRCWRLNQPEHW
jgi:hypothetical protein